MSSWSNYARRLKNGDTWNEIELIEYLSSPLLVLADFNTPYFRLFAKRHISAIVGEHELYGEPDTFIAKGTDSPQKPLFCFHAKRFEESQGKTRGQLLAAMLAAQTNNQRPHPIYGMYVIDQAWYFAILQGKVYYSMSHSFTADTETIIDIFKILKALKAILLGIVQNDGCPTR